MLKYKCVYVNVLFSPKKKTVYESLSLFYTSPKPLVFSIAVINLSLSFCLFEYSGNNSLLKHVKAVGNLSLSGPFLWI